MNIWMLEHLLVKKILGDYADIKINKSDKYSPTYGKEFVDNINWFDLYKEANK